MEQMTPPALEQAVRAQPAAVAALGVLEIVVGGVISQLSVIFLCSVLLLDGTPRHALAGAAGLVGGAVVFLIGLRTIARPGRSPSRAMSEARIARHWPDLLRNVSLSLSWPTIWFVPGLIDWVFALPFVLLGAVIWSYVASWGLAADLCALAGWRNGPHVRRLIHLLEVLALLATGPSFGIALVLL